MANHPTRILWSHTFPPNVKLGGMFMHLVSRELISQGVHVALYYLGSWSKTVTLPLTLWRLRRVAKDFDAVHAQYGSGCGLATSVLPGPKILTLRGSDWYGSKENGFRGRCHDVISRWMTRLSLHRYDVVIVVSERMKRDLISEGFAGRIEVIPDGIDLSVFQPMDRIAARGVLGIVDDDNPWILFASTVQSRPEKRFALAQETFEIVKKRLPQAKFIVASGVSQELMPAFVNGSDVVLLTSTHEGWPNIIKEAMACNVPFVSTDVSDLRDISAKASSCQVAEPIPEQLASCVLSALASERRFETRAQIAHMDVKNAARSLIDIYAQIGCLHAENKKTDYSTAYIFTFATEIVGLLTSVFVYRLAMGNLGETGFSIFMLARRSLSLVVPALLVGLGISVTRYVAMADAGFEKRSSYTYLISALGIIAVGLSLFIFFVNVSPRTFSFLFFGATTFDYLVPSLSLLLVGQMLFSVCYAYFRGRMDMITANIFELCNGLAPLVAVVFWGESVISVIKATGLITCIIAFTFLLRVLANTGQKITSLNAHTRDLLHYGIRRVPGDFAFIALFALPAVITAHLVGVREGGIVGFGLSIVTMMATPFSPLSKTILPMASRMFHSGQFARLKADMRRALWLCLTLVLCGTVAMELFLEFALKIYLGAIPEGMIGIVRILILAAPPFCLFVSFRGVIDAVYRKAINAQSCYIALAAFIGVTLSLEFVIGGKYPTLIGFVAGMYVLGALCVREILKLEDRTLTSKS